jgi:predicted unusual protein kinase regulating ubiquinone biosynthesis (AarF/ABC1/UbiB family)
MVASGEAERRAMSDDEDDDERGTQVPTGRLSRFAKLLSVGARTGASLLMSRDGRGAAEHAAEVLGSLRGLAAKVGQMASYVDGFVPDDHRESYERAMGKLLSSTPQSSPAAIRKVVESELGKPISELFATWDDEPIASASIGQVHRATLPGGREVAVKVQHPGIDRAIEADLNNAGVLQSMVGALVSKNIGVKDVFDIVKQRFREELDYELEATRQRRFRDFHAGDEHIGIPEVIDGHCSRRVLTTELVHGISLDEVAATASVEQRRHLAETLWRFVFRGNLVAGMFNADPHPGNYLFAEDGRVWFLDFGCVQEIGEHELTWARRTHKAAIAGDESGFERGVASMMFLKGGASERAVLDYVRLCFRPLFEAPFRLDREYVTKVVREIQSLKRFTLSRDPSVVAMPPGLVFMNRLQFGFYSVLARLDVDADYAGVEQRVMETDGI